MHIILINFRDVEMQYIFLYFLKKMNTCIKSEMFNISLI